MKKPRDIFDREVEWKALSTFAGEPPGRARLGVVYGRRRQGKSWLLERIAARSGGRYWEAMQGTPRQQLDAFASAVRDWTGLVATPRFQGWADALDALWRLPSPLVVFDEFQNLVESSPELPSLIQARVARAGGPRLVLCGSALGPMRGLLGTSSPLRGRASLELVVRPFDYRAAARYWRTGANRDCAMELHALVGGTPAYRDFAASRVPSDFETFDDWVCDVLLNPSGALFREGRILADEPVLVERGLYHGILAAVAAGRTRRGQIAAALGRPDNTLAHPLNTLVDLALLDRLDDPLRERRSTFRLAEPLLRTHQLLIAPNEGTIERRGAKQAWRSLRATVSASIYRPHFEHLAREWTLAFASEQTLGGMPSRVGPSSAADPDGRTEREIDVLATRGRDVLALGEAKWSVAPVGTAILMELEHKKRLVGARAKAARLLLFSRSGFHPELRAVARRRSDLELVDLRRLYAGS